MRAFEQTHRRDGAQNPGQFSMDWDVRLPEKAGSRRVQPASKKIECEISHMRLQFRRILNRRKSVVVSDEIESFPFFLKLNRWEHRPEIVPDMQRTRRLQPGEITDHWQDVARIAVTARGSWRFGFRVPSFEFRDRASNARFRNNYTQLIYVLEMCHE